LGKKRMKLFYDEVHEIQDYLLPEAGS